MNGRLATQAAMVYATLVTVFCVFGDRIGANKSGFHSSEKHEDGRNPAAKKVLRTKLLPYARQILKLKMKQYQESGRVTAEELQLWSRRVTDAETMLAETKPKRMAAIEAHHRRLQALLGIAKQLYRSGRVKQGDVLVLQYYISETELKLMLRKDK